MKTTLLLFTVIFAGIMTGCNKAGINFSLSNQADFRVESSSPINLPFEMGTPEVTTNSSQEFQNNNTAANLIKEVKLEELKLTIMSPSGKTFSFLKSVQIFISTNSNDEIELASLDNIASSSQTISLNTSTQNLDKYVKSNNYKLRTRVVTKETVTQAIDIRANIKFRIKASPL